MFDDDGQWMAIFPPCPMCFSTTGTHVAGCNRPGRVPTCVPVPSASEVELRQYLREHWQFDRHADLSELGREAMYRKALEAIKFKSERASDLSKKIDKLREFLTANFAAECSTSEMSIDTVIRLLKRAQADFKPGDKVWLLNGDGPFVVVKSGRGLRMGSHELTNADVVLLTTFDASEPDLPYPENRDDPDAHCWQPGWIVEVALTKEPPVPNEPDPLLPIADDVTRIPASVVYVIALSSVACAIGGAVVAWLT